MDEPRTGSQLPDVLTDDPEATVTATDRIDSARLAQLRREFPILRRAAYLNSCSLGALSDRAKARLDGFLDDWHELGASAWHRRWLARVEELRGRVAAFWGSNADEVALLPTASTAISAVAHAAKRLRAPAPGAGCGQGRNRVVCTDLDFPTLAYQWAVQDDVELVVLESEDGMGIDPQQFADAVDDRTFLLATSHVFFTTGFAQDLPTLSEIAHDAGALCLIDGYQGAGQLPLSVGDTGVDAYVAGPLKWLCGGAGLAYLYVREELIASLEPVLTSWFATENQFSFDIGHFRLRQDARRFELGTPALPTVHTALGGQSLIDDVGIERIAGRNATLARRFVEGARTSGLDVRYPDPEHRSAILTVRHPDPASAVKRLAERDIVVDHRPGLVRVSPHFYNTETEIDLCVEALSEFKGCG